ncbi:MAG: hypothetical protein Q8S84_01280 [bacterium]|nr:hypothetical protein [bacterium]
MYSSLIFKFVSILQSLSFLAVIDHFILQKLFQKSNSLIEFESVTVSSSFHILIIFQLFKSLILSFTLDLISLTILL